jgi:prepilin-type N-terminal cleavage/methylation domain-containing protein
MSDRSRGFTLIEVLLAVAILTIGGIGLVSATSQCIATARRARLFNTARALIGRVELEHPLRAEDIEETVHEGEFEGGPDGVHWARIIEPYGEEEDRLFQVTVRVSWTDRSAAKYEEIVTLLRGPEVPE